MNLSARVPTSLSVAVTVSGAGAIGGAANFGFLSNLVVTAPFVLAAAVDRLVIDFLPLVFFAMAFFVMAFFTLTLLATVFLTVLLALLDFRTVFFLLSVLVFTGSSLLGRHVDERRELGDQYRGGWAGGPKRYRG